MPCRLTVPMNFRLPAMSSDRRPAISSSYAHTYIHLRSPTRTIRCIVVVADHLRHRGEAFTVAALRREREREGERGGRERRRKKRQKKNRRERAAIIQSLLPQITYARQTYRTESTLPGPSATIDRAIITGGGEERAGR